MLQQELCSSPLPFSDQGRDLFLTRSGIHTHDKRKLCLLYWSNQKKNLSEAAWMRKKGEEP